jgi:hypothetical protein
VNRKIGKRKSKTVKASVSTKAAPSTQSQLQNLSPHPAPAQKRSALVLILEIFGVLAAIATVVASTGYVFEKWQDTIATMDFSGDIDQKKPFTIPLIVKNPSSILAIHVPRISCSIEVEYNDGDKGQVLMSAVQPQTGGLAIAPGEPQNYFCNAPDNFTITAGATPGGAVIPIKQADMMVTFDYETWVPWPIQRHVTAQFVMFQTASGFRWVKGKWIGTKQGIVWPANVRHPPREPAPQ